MQKIILSAAITLCCSSIIAQQNDAFADYKFMTDVDNPLAIIQKNGITKETVYEYGPKNQSYPRVIKKNSKLDSTLQRLVLYNPSGTIAAIQNFSGNDKMLEKYSYQYSNDKQFKKTVIKVFFNDVFKETVEIEYDSLGRELNQFEYNADSTMLFVKHKEYNSSNQLVAIFEKHNLEELYISSKFNYDAKGGLISVDFFGADKNLRQSLLYHVDHSQDKLGVYLQAKGKTELLGEYFYDSSNNLIAVNRSKNYYSYNGYNDLSSYNQADPYRNTDATGYPWSNQLVVLNGLDSRKDRIFIDKNSLGVKMAMQPYVTDNTSGGNYSYTSIDVNDTDEYEYNADGTLAAINHTITGENAKPVTTKIIKHYYFK